VLGIEGSLADSASSPTTMRSRAFQRSGTSPFALPSCVAADVQSPATAGASTPGAPSADAAKNARNLRSERENWARRGLAGASPPPRDCTAQGSVRVMVRCRPACLLGEEASTVDRDTTASASSVPGGVTVIDNTMVEVQEPVTGRMPKRFRMDRTFGGDASTADVFAAGVKDLVHAVASGSSAAVLAYGPTGAGKTHTMHGTAGGEPGLVQLAASELLQQAGGKPVSVSMLELHNDTLADLLVAASAAAPPLEVRGGSAPGSTATVEGAREVQASNLNALLTTMRTGLARRQVAATLRNSASSRSHVIVILGLGEGRLTLVDLAGLERVKRSGVEGSMLREAQSVNRSLQSLSDVVEALRRGAPHVPCRNSKLARLLAGPLSGSSETVAVVSVAPGAETCDEALAALFFAERLRRLPAKTGSTTGSPQGVRPRAERQSHS